MLTHNRNTHPLGQATKGIASMYTKAGGTQKNGKCRCGANTRNLKQLSKITLSCSMLNSPLESERKIIFGFLIPSLPVIHLSDCGKGIGTLDTKADNKEIKSGGGNDGRRLSSPATASTSNTRAAPCKIRISPFLNFDFERIPCVH